MTSARGATAILAVANTFETCLEYPFTRTIERTAALESRNSRKSVSTTANNFVEWTIERTIATENYCGDTATPLAESTASPNSQPKFEIWSPKFVEKDGACPRHKHQKNDPEFVSVAMPADSRCERRFEIVFEILRLKFRVQNSESAGEKPLGSWTGLQHFGDLSGRFFETFRFTFRFIFLKGVQGLCAFSGRSWHLSRQFFLPASQFTVCTSRFTRPRISFWIWFFFVFRGNFVLQIRKLEKAVAVRNSLLEKFSGKFRRCWKVIRRFSGSTKCYPWQGLGIFRQGKWLLENWPRLRERCWIFSSETATAFLSSSEQRCHPKNLCPILGTNSRYSREMSGISVYRIKLKGSKGHTRKGHREKHPENTLKESENQPKTCKITSNLRQTANLAPFVEFGLSLLSPLENQEREEGVQDESWPSALALHL